MEGRELVKRRTLLMGMGAITSLGIPTLGTRRSRDEISVKIWLTESAATYEGVAERAAGYIEQSIDVVGFDTDVTYGETSISHPSADDEHFRRVGWPRMVLEGVLGLGDVDPVGDVNLLVTDGDATGKTAGYAVSNIAAVAGAKRIAEMAPAEETPVTVPYSVPAAITQLVIHECGHALGLGHDHGRISVTDETATASPMVSGYAWASESVRREHFDIDSNKCGTPIMDVTDHSRQLSMQFSPCAADAVRAYDGGLLP